MVTVENEWHGFDREWHTRIHPKHDKHGCLMCEIEKMADTIDRITKYLSKYDICITCGYMCSADGEMHSCKG